MKCPAFFKFFIAEINNGDMKIPKAFITLIGDSLPKKVYFKDRSKNIWSAKVAKVGEAWHFMDGWAKFVGDNLLESGDLLVFEYFLKGFFYVQIYGLSGVEKKGFNVSTSIGAQEADEIFCQCHEDNNDDGDDNEETESNDYIFKKQNNEMEGNKFDANNEEVWDIGEREEENEKRNIGCNTKRNRGRPPRDLTAQRYGMDIFKAGLIQQPQNPYFVTKVMAKRKSNLFVPIDVMKDNSIDFSKKTCFMDPQGRKFRAKCKQWSDGRVVISGGWRKLCNLNLVDKDDRCICEIVEEESGILINVSFVRADNLQS